MDYLPLVKGRYSRIPVATLCLDRTNPGTRIEPRLTEPWPTRIQESMPRLSRTFRAPMAIRAPNLILRGLR